MANGPVGGAQGPPARARRRNVRRRAQPPDRPARPARLRALAGSLLLTGLGLGVLAMAADHGRDLVRDWGSGRVLFGAGMLAVPGAGLSCLMLAIMRGRSAILARPLGKVDEWLFGLSLAFLASVATFPITGAVVSARLRADGYTRCERGYEGKLGLSDWVRPGTLCDLPAPLR